MMVPGFIAGTDYAKLIRKVFKMNDPRHVGEEIPRIGSGASVVLPTLNVKKKVS